MGRFSCLALIMTTVLLASFARALDVASCGQVVAAHTTGVLQIDLDCMPTPSNDVPNWGFGIELENGATLDLNGHTLAVPGGGNFAAVLCFERCTVTSSAGIGTVSGPGAVPDEGNQGIANLLNKGKVSVSALTVSGFGQGVFGSKVQATNVTVSNNFRGLRAAKAVLDNVTVNDNSDGGIVLEDAPSRLRITNSTISGSSHFGIFIGGSGGGGLAAAGITVMNNGCAGVVTTERKRVLLSNSQVSGQTIDVETATLPRLLNTACGTSSHLVTSACTDAVDGPWGVCANDP
jgi:hypothetical protein